MTLLRDEGLTAEELAVWRMLQRAQVRITRRLESELLVAHDLPLASYEVLMQLAEAAGRRLRMNDLADRVLLSRSGLTRLIDRLQREGLVTREACPDDARGLFAVLTDAGALHRGWVSVRSALTTYDARAVLQEAARGEDNAVARYRKALKQPLPDAVKQVVERQFQQVQRNHDEIKRLRDSA